jgi:riboflavin kinase / FMN adenylyltransferase
MTGCDGADMSAAMERINLAAPMPGHLRGGVMALGNFDGFHLGHQAVVGRAIARAHHERRPALAATFDPHPAAFFRPDTPPFQLTSLDQRQRMFAAAGADAMVVIPFDAALASMSAEEFVARVLAELAGAGAVVSGHGRR